MRYEIQPLSEHAVEVVFGHSISEHTHGKVMALFQYLQHHPFYGMVDLVPAYTSLAIFYDAFKLFQVEKKPPHQFIKEYVASLLSTKLHVPEAEYGLIEIPVCFEKKFAPDLSLIAESKNLDEAEIVRLFCERKYKVYMIGFAPGFPYMGIVNEKIAMPRKEIPRLRVEPGSVGIAGNQTGIYPFQTPGGWQLIGRTPVKLFDLKRPSPSLLEAGDHVKFFGISSEEFSAEKYQTKNNGA